MEQQEVRTVVESFVREINDAGQAELPATASLGELGLDSLSIVDLLFKLERTFEVSIPDEALPSLATIGDLVEYVNSERGKI